MAKGKDVLAQAQGTEIVPTIQQTPVDPRLLGDNGIPIGTEHLDREDVILPRLRMVQNTSLEGTPGKFILNTTGEEFDSVKAIILAPIRQRVMWPRPFKRGDAALCRSFDGRTGTGIGSGDCKNCQYSKWGENKERPACNEGYTILGLFADTLEPFILQVSGSSISTIKKFNSKIKYSNLAFVQKIVELRAKRTQTEKGVFYVLDIQEVGDTPFEIASAAAQMYYGLKNIVQSGSIDFEAGDEITQPTTITVDSVVNTTVLDDNLPF